jgi:hypothetical protein
LIFINLEQNIESINPSPVDRANTRFLKEWFIGRIAEKRLGEIPEITRIMNDNIELIPNYGQRCFIRAFEQESEASGLRKRFGKWH